MTTKPEISIIVPIYNVEKYLHECLESITNQTFTNWECILVNDGSTDGSAKIIDEFVDKDPRFKAIHQENARQAAARNAALRIACGKYIGFVDSDDWISPTMFERLHQLITDYDADMAQVSLIKEYTRFSHNKTDVKSIVVLNHQEVARELIFDKKIQSYLCNKLFHRKVITCEFPQGKVYEDITALCQWSKNIHRAVLSPDPLYHYRCRRGSTVQMPNIANRMDFFHACAFRMRELSETAPGCITPAQQNRYMWAAALKSAKIIARHNSPFNIKEPYFNQLKTYCRENLSPAAEVGLGWYKTFQCNLLLNHTKIYVPFANLFKHLDLHSKYRRRYLFN